MGHTQGTWRVRGQTEQGLAIMSDDPAPDGRIVAIAVGPHRGEIDETTAADARLIAAAPELLDVVRKQQRIIDAQSALLMAYRVGARKAPEAALRALERLTDVERAARAAEAKATGEMM